MRFLVPLTLTLHFMSGVQAKITPLPLPPTLKTCMDNFKNHTYYRKDPAEQISINCLGAYLWTNVDIKCSKISKTTLDLFARLLKPVFEEMYLGRRKRQARSRRIEYRSMTTSQRNIFHSAVRGIKNNGVYDRLANYHDSRVERTAHFGPGFLPWHRLYLIMYERALKQRNPRAILPYWDSTLDSRTGSPRESLMWTQNFVGNGNGAVRTGPFAGWRGLTRNHGTSGSLLTDAVVQQLMRIRSSTTFSQRLEQAHNTVHNWVGGSMSTLGSSSRDPVFFMHHANIDRIWRDWQTRAGAAGFRYPSNGRGAHAANANMINVRFQNRRLTNRAGYGRRFYNLVDYASTPSRCGGGCRSPQLRCSGGRCMAGLTGRAPSTSPPTVVRPRPQTGSGGDPFNIGNIFGSGGRNPTVHPHTGGGGRDPFNIGNIFGSGGIRHQPLKLPHGGHFNIDKIIGGGGGGGNPFNWKRKKRSLALYFDPEPFNDNSCFGFSVQNTFRINCEDDYRLWSYIPIKIIHIRTRGKIYNSYPIIHGKVDYTSDIFSNTISQLNWTHHEHPASYQYCSHDESGVVRVNVKSNGMNYRGAYSDYAFLDNRLPVDSKILYIGFKKPGIKSSNVFFSAFDHCGRMCRAMCRVPGTHPSQYKSCSGYFKIDKDAPRNYGDSISEASLKYWNFKQETDCPLSMEENVDLAFYCDYRSHWWRT